MLFVTEWEYNKFEDLEMAVEQAVAHCGVIWKVMSTQEWGSYNSGAKDAVVTKRNNRMERHESYGQPISQVQQAKRKVDDSENHMKRMLMDAQKSQDLEDVRAFETPMSKCPPSSQPAIIC